MGNFKQHYAEARDENASPGPYILKNNTVLHSMYSNKTKPNFNITYYEKKKLITILERISIKLDYCIMNTPVLLM